MDSNKDWRLWSFWYCWGWYLNVEDHPKEQEAIKKWTKWKFYIYVQILFFLFPFLFILLMSTQKSIKCMNTLVTYIIWNRIIYSQVFLLWILINFIPYSMWVGGHLQLWEVKIVKLFTFQTISLLWTLWEISLKNLIGVSKHI